MGRPIMGISIQPVPELSCECECRLCSQSVSAERQVPLELILIERFGVCPNCCQQVPKEIEDAYWYRSRWARRVKAISRKKGWSWQYS